MLGPPTRQGEVGKTLGGIDALCLAGYPGHAHEACTRVCLADGPPEKGTGKDGDVLRLEKLERKRLVVLADVEPVVEAALGLTDIESLLELVADNLVED